jgi:hypothetical protein
MEEINNVSNPKPTKNYPARLAYNYSESCYWLGDISSRVLGKMIASGELRPIEGHRLISHQEIERFIKEKTKKPE